MRLAIFVATLVLAPPAVAQECSSYVGSTLHTQSFAQVRATLSEIPNVKGEFETTADFEARQRAFLSGFPEGPIVIETPLDLEYVEYNADSGVFSVKSFAIQNQRTDFNSLFGTSGEFSGSVPYSMLGQIMAVLDKRESRTGSYPASNAFGANVRVEEISRIIDVIYEGIPPRGRGGAHIGDTFPQTEGNIIFRISVPPTEARAARDGFRAAWIIEPKPPFYLEGPGRGFRATFDVPRDVDETLRVIVADMRCGVLLDASNTVLASAPTH